jgi:hypothetical protein
MSFKTKIMIFLAAALLTLIVFNLMVSPALLDIAKLKNRTTYEITVTARAGTIGNHVHLKTG